MMTDGERGEKSACAGKKAERDFREGELRKEMRKMEKRHSAKKIHSGEKTL